MKTGLLSALMLTVASLPLSHAAADSVKMMGAGNVTCKEWAQLRASTEYFSAGNWVLGFLSSTAWNTGDNILSGKKADGLFMAIDKYCSEMPKQTIADAAVELTSHLLDKAPRE